MKRYLLIVFLGIFSHCGPGAPGPMKFGSMAVASDNPAPQSQSNDILAREAQSNFTKVKHILVTWDKNDGKAHPNAAGRDKKAAENLALSLLERIRAGEDIEPLMAEFSEDPGSAQSGVSYDVKPDAALVFEFKRMGLRLKPGETGLVLSDFGWHIMQRVQ